MNRVVATSNKNVVELRTRIICDSYVPFPDKKCIYSLMYEEGGETVISLVKNVLVTLTLWCGMCATVQDELASELRRKRTKHRKISA
jgi:hypothetical protein